MKARWLLGGALAGALLLPAPAWAEPEATESPSPSPSTSISTSSTPSPEPTTPTPTATATATASATATPTPTVTVTRTARPVPQRAPQAPRERQTRRPTQRPQIDSAPVKARPSVAGTPEAAESPVVAMRPATRTGWPQWRQALFTFGVGGLMVSVGGLLFMWTRRRAWAHGDNDISVEHDPTELYQPPRDPWAARTDTVEIRRPY